MESFEGQAWHRTLSVPICKEHVAKGLRHVLSLSVKNGSKSSDSDKPDKLQILKHVFDHPEAKSSLKKGRADQLLKELIPSAGSEPCAEDVDEVIKDTGRDVMNFPLPPPPPGLLKELIPSAESEPYAEMSMK